VCGRYILSTRRSDELQAWLAETLDVEPPPSDSGFERFNLAPTQQVPAVVDDHDGRRIEQPQWGIVPHWAKELKTRFSMINARAETLDQRPAYRRLVARAANRCLILADRWYEWQRPEDRRQPNRPLHFSLADDESFCFGSAAGARPPTLHGDPQAIPGRQCQRRVGGKDLLHAPVGHAWRLPASDSAP
jgi:putative SOS response-associated peptidase YedK